jgi:exo-1,4-beta-D-glucosaminidase
MGKFAQYNIFTDAMGRSLGEAASMEDYSRKSQLMAYDAERAMFEAYGANKYTSTGVIQWMMNNAWPSFIWHLYDYSLTPGGGFFGTRKANEPLHVQYRYDERTVDVVNSTLETHEILTVSASLYDLTGKRLFRKQAATGIGPDGVVRTFAVPTQVSATFLKLELHDAAGHLVSDNFYVLPAKLADLQWDNSNYFYTPANTYADLRDLAQLPKAEVRATARHGEGKGVVRLTNTGSGVAFFLHAVVVKPGTSEEIVPVFWSDNFVSLLPGESRELSYELPAFADGPVSVKLEGWNLAVRELTVSAAK